MLRTFEQFVKERRYITNAPSQASWESYSAFTVAELGEMLSEDRDLPWHGNGVWFWSVMSEDGTEKTEADARAKMLIYLVEHGLSSPTEKQSTAQ
ncbi:MAG: hypothetical protein LAO76_04485 [Acidobacteriia bacterium]|nr:hypothetical protein [Terriglobia bacterium]